MSLRVILPEALLRQALGRFVREPWAWAFCPAGVSRTKEGKEWLVRRVEFSAGGQREGPSVLLTAQPALRSFPAAEGTPVVHCPRDGQPSAALFHPDGRIEPMTLRLLGPGLPEFPPPPTRPLPSAEGRWSRTVGALGEAAWQRLVSLRYAIVGCGRNGSLMAANLIRLGVRSLVLIDPDRVEEHHLGEMEAIAPQDIGRPKAEALAERLRALEADLSVRPILHSITSLEALPAVKASDVLIVCADNDGARWACGLLSVYYLKPLLDVGTGVLRNEGRERGADVRLILPGDACLACLGGVAHPEQVAITFRSCADEERFQAQRHWRQERAGSLRSLNLLAVSLALRLWEEFLRGSLRRSLWLHLEFDGRGLPSLRCHEPAPSRSCPLCPLLGQGDAFPTPLPLPAESHSGGP